MSEPLDFTRAMAEARALLPSSHILAVVDVVRARFLTMNLAAGVEGAVLDSLADVAFEMFRTDPQREEIVMLSPARIAVVLRTTTPSDLAVCYVGPGGALGLLLTRLHVARELIDRQLLCGGIVD